MKKTTLFHGMWFFLFLWMQSITFSQSEPSTLLGRASENPYNGYQPNSTQTSTQYSFAEGDVQALEIFPNSGIFGSFPLVGPYTINQVGTLTPSIFAADIDADGILYGLDFATTSLVAIDTVDGATQTIGNLDGINSGHTVTGIAWNAINSTMYALTTNGSITTLYTVDLSSGALTVIGDTGNSSGIWIAIDNNGNCYMADIADDILYAVNLETGAGVAIGSLNIDISFAQDADFDPVTNQLYMAGFLANNTSNVYLVDLTTGATTLQGSTGGAELAIFAIEGIEIFNDDPIDAKRLTVRDFFEDSPRVGDSTDATDSAIVDPSIPEPTCSNYEGGDLWYKIIVPDTGDVTLETKSEEGSPVKDTAMSVYAGTIDALVELECDSNDNGLFSLIKLEGRTPGEVIYIRIFRFEGDIEGTFQISAYDIPPPVNDNLGGVVALTVGAAFTDQSVVGRNTSTTASEVEDPTITNPSCSSYAGGDVWYSVQVPSTGELTIETNSVLGSTLSDTGINVYEGKIASLVEVACDDDGSEDGLFSLITVNGRTPGETLYIRVFEPDNDVFGEFQIAAYSDCVVDGATIEITGTFGSTGTTICAGLQTPIDVTITGNPVGTNMGWLITDDATGEIVRLPLESPFDLSDAPVGVCNIWHIRYEDGLDGLNVGGNAADLTGCFDLSDPIVVTKVADESPCPPPNNDCANAIEVMCGDTITGSTVDATDSGGDAAGDVFYTFTTPDTVEEVTISLCDGGTNYDSILRVFDDGCNLANEVAFNDDSCALQSQVMFTPVKGVTYTIMVEGFSQFGNGAGDFSLAVTCEPFLSVNSAQFDNFTLYPNPAQERINLNAQQTIEHVTIFNMLGQEVLNQKIDVTNTQLDISNLSAGNYIMQVIIDGQKGVYQVLKN